VDVCEACGGHARRPDSPEKDLRGRDCPKFGHVHRGCCREQDCSAVDAQGAVRCGWDQLTKAQRRRHREEAQADDGADGEPAGPTGGAGPGEATEAGDGDRDGRDPGGPV
jgi:hypothetical protein